MDLARLVGASGRVVAVDIQPRMIERLKRRAAKAGLGERVDARVARPDSMGLTDIAGTVDFALVFAVVHELPAEDRFFAEAAEAMKPGACLLLAEPAGHVKAARFEAELQAAARVGLEAVERPSIPRSHAALLRKG